MKTEKEIQGLIDDALVLNPEERMVEMIEVTMGYEGQGGYVERRSMHPLYDLTSMCEMFLEGGTGDSLTFTLTEMTEKDFHKLDDLGEFEGW